MINSSDHLFRVTEARPVWLPLHHAASNDEGYTILYIYSDECTLIMNDHSVSLGPRTIILLKNRQTFSVQGKDGLLTILSLHPLNDVKKTPHLNLSQMVREHDNIRVLLEHTDPYFILTDVEQIHILLAHLIVELCGNNPAQDQVVQLMLETFFLKCVRSSSIVKEQPGYYVLREAKNYLMTHFKEKINATVIADHIGISRSYLESLFGQHKGHSLNEYINHMRIDEAAFLLSSSDHSIAEIIEICGFHSRQHFARVFEAQMGFSPRDYRKLFRVSINTGYLEKPD